MARNLSNALQPTQTKQTLEPMQGGSTQSINALDGDEGDDSIDQNAMAFQAVELSFANGADDVYHWMANAAVCQLDDKDAMSTQSNDSLEYYRKRADSSDK